MRRITLHIEDDRFDDMDPTEVPVFLFELIRHRLWQLTDPRTHISEIAVAVPPEPVQPAISKVNPEAVNDLVQMLMELTAVPKAA